MTKDEANHIIITRIQLLKHEKSNKEIHRTAIYIDDFYNLHKDLFDEEDKIRFRYRLAQAFKENPFYKKEVDYYT